MAERVSHDIKPPIPLTDETPLVESMAERAHRLGLKLTGEPRAKRGSSGTTVLPLLPPETTSDPQG